jgi:single-stranded DNA-binding protein
VGWNNLADEMVEKYHKGDQVVVEGRLRLDTVDRGTYKEKRTELVAQRVHTFGTSGMTGTPSTASPVATARSNKPANTAPIATATNAPPAYVPVAAPAYAPDYDDIPF